MNPDAVLPVAMLDSLAILERGSQSVRAILANEDNRFTRALGDLKRLAITENIPIAVVGGLGAIHYGYPAATQDIDIVVGKDHLERLLEAAPKFNVKVAWRGKNGWLTLTHDDVEINVVPEGGKARVTAPTTIPGPTKLGVTTGLDYANLPGWLELKLSSGRQKDRAHIVEVMKASRDGDIEAARPAIAALDPSYLRLFDELWEQAKEERTQEDEREA
jgi:hypothetical protein